MKVANVVIAVIIVVVIRSIITISLAHHDGRSDKENESEP